MSSRGEAINFITNFNSLGKTMNASRRESLSSPSSFLDSARKGKKEKAKGLISENRVLQRNEFNFVKKIDLTNKLNQLGRFEAHGKIVFYSRTSLFLFDEDNLMRRGLVWLVTWK